MNSNDFNIQIKKVNESSQDGPYYVDDIDSPTFDYLHKQIITKNFVLEPLGYRHFLDLFEFRLQNESEDKDPFSNLGERFEKAYSEFFDYVCNVDNLAWVMIERTYITGFFLLQLEVDYNRYMERNAHLSYEMHFTLDQQDVHREVIKGIADHLFWESDIPKLQLLLDETDDDKESMKALLELGFKRHPSEDDESRAYYMLENDDPRLKSPPRHMPFIMKAYREKFMNRGMN